MRYGFSLVELSIVLVILGLLTGGILTGQSLIRASELRSVHVEAQKYLAAVYTFKDKYLQGPGDLNNATSFWGDDNTNCADAAVPNGSPGTCNGDGDGIPERPLAVSTTGEIFQFWKQLALAGMIEGTYTGIAGSGGVTDSFIGSNVPASRITNTGWSVVGSIETVGAQMYSGPTYGNYLTFGTKATNSGTGQPALRPEEAWNIDTKMDDGRPSYGKVIAKFWNNQCTAVNSGATVQTNLDASYRLTDTSIQCALHFTQLF